MNAKDAKMLDGPRRWFIFGPAGSGKTHSLRTAPKPIYVLDMDQGMSTNSGQDMEYDPFQLGRAASYRKVRDKLLKLRNKCPYKTVVIDTMTALSRAVMNQVWEDNGGKWSKNAMQDYGALFLKLDEIALLLSDIREIHGAHIIVLAHDFLEKDDITGEVSFNVLLDGKKFPGTFLNTFDEIYHAESEGVPGGGRRYFWRTKKSGLVKDCRTRMPGLEEKEDADFEKVLEKGRAAAFKLQQESGAK